jgi:hypothetical protein
MPGKGFVRDYNYELCSQWDVLYGTETTQLPEHLVRLRFSRQKEKHISLASAKFGGLNIYCYLAPLAHDDVQEKLDRMVDQPIAALSKNDKLKHLTPRLIAAQLLKR